MKQTTHSQCRLAARLEQTQTQQQWDGRQQRRCYSVLGFAVVLGGEQRLLVRLALLVRSTKTAPCDNSLVVRQTVPLVQVHRVGQAQGQELPYQQRMVKAFEQLQPVCWHLRECCSA